MNRGGRTFRERENSNNNNNKREYRKDIECYNCGKLGHIARNCYSKQKKTTINNYSNNTEEIKQENTKGKKIALPVFTALSEKKNIWCIDAGSAVHLCNDINMFSSFRHVEPITLTVGNSNNMKADIVGEINVVSVCDRIKNVLCLNNVYYAPFVPYNLLSPLCFNSNVIGTYFVKGLCTIFMYNKDGTTSNILKSDINNIDGYFVNLPIACEQDLAEVDEHVVSCFVVKHENNNNNNFNNLNNLKNNNKNKISEEKIKEIKEMKENNVNFPNTNESKLRDDILLFHDIHGHPNMRKTIEMMNININKNFSLPVCHNCLYAKSHRKPFRVLPDENSQTNYVGELIHSDIVGPLPATSKYKYKYILTFIDSFSNYATIYLLTNKTVENVCDKFANFYTLLHTQVGAAIKRIRTDNGSEYISHVFNEFVKRNGIIHEYTHTYTPQSNGKAERFNRTLIECANAIRFRAGLPIGMWGVAVQGAVYLINRLPSKAIYNEVPYNVFWGRKPDDRPLAVLGCECFVHVPKELRKKLDVHAIRCILVGYDTDRKGYICMGLNDSKIYYSRDVIFNNSVFPLKNVGNGATLSVDPAAVAGPDEPPTLLGVINDDKESPHDTDGGCGGQAVDAEEVDDLEYVVIGKDSDGSRSDSFSTRSVDLLSPAKYLDIGSSAYPYVPGAYGKRSESPGLDAHIVRPTQEDQNKGPRRTSRVSQPSREQLESVASEADWRGQSVMQVTVDAPEDPDLVLVEDAMSGSNRTKWRAAMEIEIQALQRNETWVLVDRAAVEELGHPVI